ncbi:hypothetical protein PRIPAC_83436 [Pristionchus pacificus]|uniref:RING-type domain-containing protein n=1 Tax=Pristionchus pacificus TaxID=54126 RepID=A0A2A6BP58_PRIPA|nr:hypothetical protein PRIPAC_83436 [Pristionchus pacificus]|eukprot:PDM67563.1 hypothetical protein PRIPAC_48980 [Pristionchus pacificus]
MTRCGHFICRGCALKMRFEAAELSQSLLCAVCRGEGRFVVMTEELAKETMKEGTREETAADAHDTLLREVEPPSQPSIRGEVAVADLRNDEERVLAEAAAASAAFDAAEDAYNGAENACVVAKNELCYISDATVRAGHVLTYRANNTLAYLAAARPISSREDRRQITWDLEDAKRTAELWEAALHAAEDRTRFFHAHFLHLKAVAEVARAVLETHRTEMIAKHDEVEAMVGRLMKENEESSTLGLRFSRRCGSCKMDSPLLRSILPACGHAVCRECAERASASEADAKCPTCQTAGGSVPLLEEIEEEEATEKFGVVYMVIGGVVLVLIGVGLVIYCCRTITIMKSTKNSLNLATLPVDIIRRILEGVEVSLATASLVAPSWNTLIREYRKDFYKLDYCHLHFSAKKLDIILSVKTQNFRNLKKCTNADERLQWIKYKYPKVGFYAVWTSIPISKDPNDEPGRLKDRFLSHILNRLFLHYKPIRRMEVIFNISSKRHIAIVENAFHPKLVINILIVDSTTFDEKLENFTLTTLKMLKLDELRIRTSDCDAKKMRKYLLQVSKLTPALYLQQKHPEAPTSEELFERPPKFWSVLATEMIKNGMMSVTMDHGINRVVCEVSHLRHIMLNLEP